MLLFYKFLKLGALANVLILIVLPIYFWNQLPEQVSINGGKTAGRGVELLIPIIGVIIYLVMLLLRRVPHHFNYLVKITEKNAGYQFGLALKLMVWVNFLSMIMFMVACYSSIQSALRNYNNIGLWILMALLLVMSLVVIYFIRRMKLVK